MKIIVSLHNQPKILRKSSFSTIFSEKSIFANFHIFNPILRGRADLMTSLWRHMKINGTHFAING